MPRPSPLASTNADPASPPAAQPEQSPPAGKRRGNPNLALVPRCGARTRAGCPCRAPAIHGKQRCRMHGGRSTGPRTPEGRARVAAARTKHGGFSAEARAFNRHHVTFMRRGSLRSFAVIYYRLLPPELAARMNPIAPELLVPPRPTCGITRAEDRAMLQAETAALAPWKHAMALARQARRAAAAARAAASGAMAGAQAGPLAPEQGRVRLPPARRRPQPPLWRRGQKPMHQFGRSPPRVLRGTRRRAAVRTHWQNPLHQNAPHAARAAPRHKPGWRGGQEPMHLTGRRARLAPARRRGPTLRRHSGQNPLHQFRRPPPRMLRGRRRLAAVRRQPAKPHATERPGCGAMGGSAPAGSAARPTAHAPNRAPLTRTGSRTVPAGRAARRWLRQQKLMHQKQPAGGQP